MEGLDCGLMAMLNWSTRTTFGVSNSFALAVVQEELAQHLLRHNGEPIVALIHPFSFLLESSLQQKNRVVKRCFVFSSKVTERIRVGGRFLPPKRILRSPLGALHRNLRLEGTWYSSGARNCTVHSRPSSLERDR